MTFSPIEDFTRRHIGPGDADTTAMLAALGAKNLDTFIETVVPEQIRTSRPLNLPAALTEEEALARLRGMASQNHVYRSLLGLGYADTITPRVIQRNILENPGWYTAYTPYQAEVSQGRLEALLNYQQMIIDMTGLEIANASLLDESTAAAEAMHLMHAVHKKGTSDAKTIFVDQNVFPQTLDVIQTRAEALAELEAELAAHGYFDQEEVPFDTR